MRFEGWEEDEYTTIYCPYCQKRGYPIQLGPKILEPNESVPADYENYLQCPTCYEVIPIYETSPTEEIKDSIETIESPFEQGKFYSQSIPKRSSPAGKKATAKRRRNKIRVTNDPDINREIHQHGEDNVHVVYDSDP